MKTYVKKEKLAGNWITTNKNINEMKSDGKTNILPYKYPFDSNEKCIKLY